MACVYQSEWRKIVLQDEKKAPVCFPFLPVLFFVKLIKNIRLSESAHTGVALNETVLTQMQVSDSKF